MTRIEKLFIKKQQGVLNVYCTAGFPELNSTLTILHALQESGSDMIEIGMPYSDPLADGPVIQYSSQQALENGMNLRLLFQQLKGMRDTIHLPVVLMGYMNPVLQYGFEQFCADAAAVGVDGLILPDMPLHEFESIYQSIADKYGLNFIFMVTPETQPDRIRKIDQLSSGFLYAVSSSATTGSQQDSGSVEKYLQKLQQMQLNNPVLVGFGIRDKVSFDRVCKYSNGGIIGTAFIQAMTNAEDIIATTRNFVQNIRE